jgi:hypothetical protein
MKTRRADDPFASFALSHTHIANERGREDDSS